VWERGARKEGQKSSAGGEGLGVTGVSVWGPGRLGEEKRKNTGELGKKKSDSSSGGRRGRGVACVGGGAVGLSVGSVLWYGGGGAFHGGWTESC